MLDDHSLIPIADSTLSPGRSSRLVSRGVARLDSGGTLTTFTSSTWTALVLWDKEWERVLWRQDSETHDNAVDHMGGTATWLDDAGYVDVMVTMYRETSHHFEWTFRDGVQDHQVLQGNLAKAVEFQRDIRLSLPGGRRGYADLHVLSRNTRGMRVGCVDDGLGIFEDGFPNFVKLLCSRWTACILDDETLVRLPSLGGPESQATAITDTGLIIGQSMTSDGIRMAVCWVNDQIDVLPGLGYEGSAYSDAATAARAVNTHGHIVGHATPLDGKQQAVRWIDGHIEILRNEFEESSAVAINDAGQIVGVGWNSGEDTRHHLLWSASGRCQTITLPGKLVAINNNGCIVGEVSTSDDHRGTTSRAFIWHDGETRSLPIPLPYTRAFVSSVNDRGDVAGYLEYDVEFGFEVSFDGFESSPGVPWQVPCVWLRSRVGA
jgi:uncharacterized membrane protein